MKRETPMTQDTQRQSAKIYQFPVGGRARVAPPKDVARRVEVIGSQRTAKIVYGSGWYHDEAVQDAAEEAGRR